jgi:hypothetical protein
MGHAKHAPGPASSMQQYRVVRNQRSIGKAWLVALGHYKALPLSGGARWVTTLVVSEHVSAQEARAALATLAKAKG